MFKKKNPAIIRFMSEFKTYQARSIADISHLQSLFLVVWYSICNRLKNMGFVEVLTSLPYCSLQVECQQIVYFDPAKASSIHFAGNHPLLLLGLWKVHSP